MSRHTNNNSHNVQLRELQYEDELQGYDVQNAKRSKKKQVKNVKRGKKKKVTKFKKDYKWEDDRS